MAVLDQGVWYPHKDALEQLNIGLGKSRYLHGGEITLSDLFSIPTLVRFEAVYQVHFKANKQPLRSFKHLYRYMLDLVSMPSIRATIDIDYMKLHYYFPISILIQPVSCPQDLKSHGELKLIGFN